MGLHTSAKWVMLDSLEVGGQSVGNLKAIVYDLTKTQGPEDARIYGIIGQDFLEHFTITIDYKHRCFVLN
jgi:hypothetical protein